MEEITIYRADDSTDFEDEYECMEYEWKANIGDNPEFKLLNGNYQELCPHLPQGLRRCGVYLHSQSGSRQEVLRCLG